MPFWCNRESSRVCSVLAVCPAATHILDLQDRRPDVYPAYPPYMFNTAQKLLRETITGGFTKELLEYLKNANTTEQQKGCEIIMKAFK